VEVRNHKTLTCEDGFLKLVCFYPWLAGKFHNFELTQNREKNPKNGLMNIYIDEFPA
jgi:hypothetical protein